MASTERWANRVDEEKRLRRDEKTLYAMAEIFCSANHDNAKDARGLCPACAQTIVYSIERTNRCPHEHKGNCEDCTIHCYQPEMRTRIREIMAFAGPRMLTKHPIMTFFYLKKKLQKKLDKNRAGKS